MDILKAIRSYEKWLGGEIKLDEKDLKQKHKNMKADVFSFMRATFYRWVQTFPQVCRDLAQAPEVLAVGDLHVENFGTWRDTEGRLIWGVNDFDEAYPLAYTNDLVRLATSAHLATRTGHLTIRTEDACAAILDGYISYLKTGGEALVLAERHAWLRDAASERLKKPEKFWKEIQSCELVDNIPRKVLKQLENMMPDPDIEYSMRHRLAGLGSLGRQRYLIAGRWRGGLVAREAKQLAPSAAVWAGAGKSKKIFCRRLMETAVRCPDPFLRVAKGWVYHRLAPDCSRIRLDSLPKEKDEAKLLTCMGRETANVHLGSRKSIADVMQHLDSQPASWLHRTAEAMMKSIEADWKDYRS